MSRENVEIVRRMLEAYLAGDVDTSLSLLAPDIEWDISAYPLPDFPNTGLGREEFARYQGQYARGWRDYRAELTELIDAGEEVVVAQHETVTVMGSDTTLDRDLYMVWAVWNGLIVQLRVFKTRVEALEAAGLSE